MDIAFALIVGSSVTHGICCSIQVLTHRFEVSPLIQIHPMHACYNCCHTITVSQTKLVFLLFLFPISSQSQGNEITAPIRNCLFEGIFYVLQYTFPNLFNLKFIQTICRPWFYFSWSQQKQQMGEFLRKIQRQRKDWAPTLFARWLHSSR